MAENPAVKMVQQQLDEVTKKLEGFDDLRQEQQRLQIALDALNGTLNIGSTRRATSSSNGGGSRPRGANREAVLTAIRGAGQNGIAPKDIRASVDISPNSLSQMLKTLREEGLVKSEGARRTIRYRQASPA